MLVAYEALMVEDSGIPEILWLALATGRQGILHELNVLTAT
jgi:hypothetical protein